MSWGELAVDACIEKSASRSRQETKENGASRMEGRGAMPLLGDQRRSGSGTMQAPSCAKYQPRRLRKWEFSLDSTSPS